MLRAAMALLSSLQIGAQIKESIDRSLKQAAVGILAAFLLIAAIVFGLIAAYHALMSYYDFSPEAAAGIMAGVLLVIGLIALAVIPAIGRARRVKRPAVNPMSQAMQGLNLADLGMGKAIQQVGPIPLLAVAFVAGVLAGRR